MLTRIRIEVSDEDSAAATSEALDCYEQAITQAEAGRFMLDPGLADDMPNDLPRYRADHLGREVTDEVIEFDPGLPGYKGRRVVQFRRIDTRSDRGGFGNRRALKGAPPGTVTGITFAAPDKAAA
jgi:hypothetical protein